MARIRMLEREETSPEGQELWDEVVRDHGRMTNMKKTMIQSATAFKTIMGWYDMLEVVKPLLGDRLTSLYMLGISNQTECPVCSTFYRRIMIDAGENPDNPVFTPEEEAIVRFGQELATNSAHMSDEVYNAIAKNYTEEQMTDIITFGAMMVVNNIFNNVADVELDDYLLPYAPDSLKK